MADPFDPLVHASAFMPHGMCYLWQPDILGLHIVSDGLISAAYFSIPFTLIYFVRKRIDLEFNWMFLCFAVFIVACGTTHVMEIWTIWRPDYWLSGTIKAITALASVPTAILLLRLVPQALRLPSPSSLRLVNTALENEVCERQRAEEEARRINAGLEERVAERTEQLEATNRRLVDEIEQRAYAEEASRASQNLLNVIVDNSPTVLFAKDLRGRYLLVNARYEKILNLERGAMLNRTDYDLFAKDVADAFRAMDKRVLAADCALTEEEAAPHADGVHTYISVKAPLRDDAGQAYGIFGISTDITELKEAERALKLSEKKLREQLARLDLLDRISRGIGDRHDIKSVYDIALASLDDHLVDFACVCLCDQNGSSLVIAAVGDASRSLAEQLGLPEQCRIELLENALTRCTQGQLVYEPDTSRSNEHFLARLARAGLHSLVLAPLAAENRVFGMIVAARRAPGSFISPECEFLRQLSQHVALAVNQAQLYSALQRAYEDLRRSQQTIMQHERLRALGQMASGVAHDINNALSPASMHAQMLLERGPELSDEIRKRIQVIHRAIDDVSLTVSRMREFGRIGNDRPPAPVRVNSTIQQVLELTRARWAAMPQERGVVVRVETELDASDPTILGAENEVRDALVNLVLNGVDAMPTGGTLTLRSRAACGQIVVEVSDTGIGMDEQTRSRCLEPFFTTKGERGTGLGLAMVFGMVQRHTAQIEIDSVPGQGTTLRIVFPARSQPTTPAKAATSSTPLTPQRVLVIDDDQLVLNALVALLTMDGHAVTAAAGGQLGIDEFRRSLDTPKRFDLVITDLGMPYVDGRQVASAVKSLSSRTPVLLLTGWGQRLQEEPEQDTPLQVDRILGKPPSLQQLRATIAELVGRNPAA